MDSKETPQHSLKTGLTPQERQEERLWLLSKGKKGVSHASVMYSRYDINNPSKINGHQAFIDFSKTELYQKYVIALEDELLKKYGARIRKHVSLFYSELIELGSGNEKIQQLVQHLGWAPYERKILYRPADVSPSALDDGFADAEKAGLRRGAPLLGDRDNPVTFSHVEDPFFLALGGGFLNGYDNIPRRLENMRSTSHFKRSKLFATGFGLPGYESWEESEKIELLKAIYGDLGDEQGKNLLGSKESYQKASYMVMKPLEALGFDPSRLTYAVQWEEGNPSKILLGAKVTEAFTEKEGDEIFEFHVGDFIPLIDSPRPTREQFIQQIESGGAEVADFFEVEGCFGSVIQLPRKKVDLLLKTTAGVAGALLLLLGGMQVGRAIEKANWQQKQEKTRNEILSGLQGEISTNDVNVRSAEMLYLFENRYGNNILTLSEKTRDFLEGSIRDFIASNPFYFVSEYYYGGGGSYYSDELYYPDEYHLFVMQHKQLLEKLRINTTPNEGLLAYHEALQNTYFYRGSTQEFDHVDKELDDYWCPWASMTMSSDEPDWRIEGLSVPTGIVNYKGKPYFVTKLGDAGYKLDKKSNGLQSLGILSSGDVAAEILARGEVQILTQKIHDYIMTQYGDGCKECINGCPEIAEFLLDYYARGGRLEYLLWSGNSKYSSFNEIALHKFVHGYLLPKIGQATLYKTMNLTEEQKKKLMEEQKKYEYMAQNMSIIDIYLKKYLTHQYDLIAPGKIESLVLQLLLSDNNVHSLDFSQPNIARARVTKYRKEFMSNLNIVIPAYPKSVDHLWKSIGGIYHPKDKPIMVSTKDLDIVLHRAYIDVNGNIYYFGVYSKNMFHKGRIVANLTNKKIENDLWLRYKKGEFGKLYEESIKYGRESPSIELTTKPLVVNRLIQTKIPYTSDNIRKILKDYEERKKAMEVVENNSITNYGYGRY